MSCNFRYESVVGTGRVEIVLEKEKEKAEWLAADSIIISRDWG